MVSKLTSQEVKSNITKLIPTAAAEKSAISLAGATNISYGVDIVRSLSLGAPGLYKEGEQKLLSDFVASDKEVYKAKLVHLFTASNEAENEPGYEEYKADLVAQATAGIIKAADVVVLNGTNPATGEARADLADVNLKENAAQAATTGDAQTDLIEVLSNTKKVSGVILSEAGFSNVAFNVNANGVVTYPGATENAPFTVIGGKRAVHSTALGVDGWTATEEVTNSNLLVAGDWSTIGRSFNGVTVRESNDATIGGRSVFEYNETAYLIEVHFSFVIPNPAQFTILKGAETEGE